MLNWKFSSLTRLKHNSLNVAIIYDLYCPCLTIIVVIVVWGSQTLRVMKFWCISEYGQWNLLTTRHAAPISKIIPWTKHIWIIQSLWFMLIIFQNKSRHSIKRGYVRCSNKKAQLLISHEFKGGLDAVWNFAPDNAIINSIKI